MCDKFNVLRMEEQCEANEFAPGDLKSLGLTIELLDQWLGHVNKDRSHQCGVFSNVIASLASRPMPLTYIATGDFGLRFESGYRSSCALVTHLPLFPIAIPRDGQRNHRWNAPVNKHGS